MQKQLDEMLQKRMDRKDFLKHVGLGVAVMTGVAGIVKLLKPEDTTSQQSASNGSPTVGMGYGASTYGGRSVSSQKS